MKCGGHKKTTEATVLVPLFAQLYLNFFVSRLATSSSTGTSTGIELSNVKITF
jgi:hypothetical protein